jgi:hypothetical protein
MKQGFWLRWMPTFVGFIAGGEVAIAAIGGMDSVRTTIVGGALAGAVIGGGQWLALRGWLPVSAWWVAATAVGGGVGLTLGAALVGYATGPAQLAIQGAVTGLAIGALQALELRRSGIDGRWWALATSPIWALGWLATWAIGVDVERQYTNFGLAGALVATALSGLVLMQMLAGQHAGRTVAPVAEGTTL